VRDHVEQVACLRISFSTEHTHKIRRRRVRQIARFLETHDRIDGVAKDPFAGVEIRQSLISDTSPRVCRALTTQNRERTLVSSWDDFDRDVQTKTIAATRMRESMRARLS
jgi:hypothetical protein